MDESKIFKLGDKTIIFTKDESIENGMVLLNMDEQIGLITIEQLDKFFETLPLLDGKIIKYKMNSISESKFAPMQEDRLKRVKKMRDDYELDKKKTREKVDEVKKSVAAIMKQMNDSMPNVRAFNLLMITEIQDEIAKLKALKNLDAPGAEKLFQKLKVFKDQRKEEEDKSWTIHDSCSQTITDIIMAANRDDLFFRESMNPEFEAFLLSDGYVADLDAQITKNMSETTSNFKEILDYMQLFSELIKSKSLVSSAEKRPRKSSVTSVSSVESDGSAAKSAHPKESLLKLVSEPKAPPLLPPRPPVELALLPPRPPVVPPRPPVVLSKKARHVEAEAKVVILDLEPEVAKESLRFVEEHKLILGTIFSKAILKSIQTKLEVFAGLKQASESEAASPDAASPEVDDALTKLILFKDRVIEEKFVVEAKSVWIDLHKASKLLRRVSDKVGACGGGGGGCPEEEIARETTRLSESRKSIWIRAEATVLETLIAEMQAEHNSAEAAAREGWETEKYRIAKYEEFIEHIRRQATGEGLIVENGIPKDPLKDPRPAIYIKTKEETPLHLTLSPDVIGSNKFHITHNNLPLELKRFYFSIHFDPGHQKHFIVAHSTGERIEIDQIAQKFIDELTKHGRPIKHIGAEVKKLLEFLMKNMDTKFTKRRGGYYDKYMKYKLKYLALKKLIY
jgi:hypothetical protein